jgi:hypothetical protein
MKIRIMKLSIPAIVIGFLLASVLHGKADLTGRILAKRIDFVDGGRPMVADGTATIENEKGETIASGKLVINDETLEVLGKKGSAFVYPSSSATTCPTNWPTSAPANVSTVEFDGKDKWTLKDDQFLFMLECATDFSAKVLIDKSLLASSRISFPEGTYSLWGYSITAGTDGGTVVFKQGLPVDGDNTTVETPEKNKLEFSHKTK